MKTHYRLLFMYKYFMYCTVHGIMYNTLHNIIIGVSRVVPRVPRHHPKHLKNIFINNDLTISLYSRLHL